MSSCEAARPLVRACTLYSLLTVIGVMCQQMSISCIDCPTIQGVSLLLVD